MESVKFNLSESNAKYVKFEGPALKNILRFQIKNNKLCFPEYFIRYSADTVPMHVLQRSQIVFEGDYKSDVKFNFRFKDENNNVKILLCILDLFGSDRELALFRDLAEMTKKLEDGAAAALLELSEGKKVNFRF